jgi:hypothetical protein
MQREIRAHGKDVLWYCDVVHVVFSGPQQDASVDGADS